MSRPLDVLVRQLQGGFADLTAGSVTHADLAAAMVLLEADIVTAVAAVVQDARYHHVQSSASTSWVVVHNLGKHAVPDFFDSTGRRFLCSYQHDSVNQLTATLVHSTAGDAYVN